MGGNEEGVNDTGIAYFPCRIGPNGERLATFGTQAVGLGFNPSDKKIVDEIKIRFADIIDAMNALRSSTADAEIKRMCSVAITEAQTAQMWAVKALTWK